MLQSDDLVLVKAVLGSILDPVLERIAERSVQLEPVLNVPVKEVVVSRVQQEAARIRLGIGGLTEADASLLQAIASAKSRGKRTSGG
jgi:hypothetical protein